MGSHKLSLLRSALVKPVLPKSKHFVRLGHDQVDQASKGGLRRGALRLVQNRQVLWIGEKFAWQEHGMPCPTGFFELGLDPSQIIFLSVAQAQDALRAAGDALTCANLGAVIVEVTGNPKILDFTASRRLVLACAQNSVPAVLLRFGAVPQTSAAETRWIVKAAPSATESDNWGHPAFDVSLVRNKNGRTGQWVFAWSCDDGRFENTKADFGAVVPTPANRPAEAA
jgi:protein ImuA